MRRGVAVIKPFSSKSAFRLSGLFLALMAGQGRAASPQDVDIRGLGQDPEWRLEISHTDRRIHLTLAGSDYSYRYPADGPTIHRGYYRTTVYRVPNDEHSLNIIVKGIECRDSETGKAYETTITVVLDGPAYKGCGDVLNR